MTAAPVFAHHGEKLLYGPAEAAAMLGISRSTLYELLAQKKIRSVHIGALRKIPHEALTEYVAGLEENTAAAGRTG